MGCTDTREFAARPLLRFDATVALVARCRGRRYPTAAPTDYKSDEFAKRECTVMDAQTNEAHAELVGDLLFGAGAIAGFLTALGLPTTEDHVYYARKRRSLPIGRYNKHLCASKKKLTKAVHAIINATADEPLQKRED